MAKQMLKENQTVLGQDIAKDAIEKIDETKEKGGNKNEEKTKRVVRNKSK